MGKERWDGVRERRACFMQVGTELFLSGRDVAGGPNRSRDIRLKTVCGFRGSVGFRLFSRSHLFLVFTLFSAQQYPMSFLPRRSEEMRELNMSSEWVKLICNDVLVVKICIQKLVN